MSPKIHARKKGNPMEKLVRLEQVLRERIALWPINTKRSSASLDIREMRIKTTVRYHLAESECLTLKTNNKNYWEEYGARAT